MKKFFRRLSLLLLLILLAGCIVKSTSSPPTISVLPTGTEPFLLITTPTLTPPPTQTSKPSSYGTITTVVAEMVATIQPLSTTFISPDHQWEVQLLNYECTSFRPEVKDEIAYDLLQIVHLSDDNTLRVTDQIQYCGGSGAYGLGGIVWSPNSRFFYFTEAAFGMPDGDNLGWQRPISRYDTVTSKIEWVGRSISPDTQKIAGVHYQDADRFLPQDLVVQTLNGDILASYRIETAQQARQYDWKVNISWDGSSQDLVYLEIPCDQSGCKSTLYRIDLKNNERTVLLIEHQPAFLEVTWSEPDRLTLTDENMQTWYYVLSTGQLEQ